MTSIDGDRAKSRALECMRSQRGDSEQGGRFGGGMEPGHTCYPMRWLLVAALTGGANANGCCDTYSLAPSCPGPGSDSGGPPAGGLVCVRFLRV
jgi:hypothetical protein